ncbi:MAG: DUF1353 domain-containing protein [Victivallales bacterium]|nr:DUF1353 domain-containing protein [Victivallales bacterium]
MNVRFHLENYFQNGKIGDKIISNLLLDEPLEFDFNGTTYTIPAGFKSDGMSVPRFLWSVISPQIDAVTLEPSIIHDFLYSEKICTREEADEWYYEALLKNGYQRIKAKLVYAGIRLFGKSHWAE